MHRSPAYCTYIIRGWSDQEVGAETPTWRFRLQDVESGSERGFATVEALLAFLKNELEGNMRRKRGPP